MYANAKPHLLTGRSIRIFLCYGVLHRDSTLHSIHGAGEVGDETIASRVKDPTVMRGDQVNVMTLYPVRVRSVPTSSSPIRRL